MHCLPEGGGCLEEQWSSLRCNHPPEGNLRILMTMAAEFIGGPPKSCKSWLGLDLAVSVASATPCLGANQINQPGPVLVYLAEDDPAAVRYRVAGL